MSDKGMRSCFCGSPILLVRNYQGDGATLEHLEPSHYLEILDGPDVTERMTRWLEEIHGLSGTGTEDMRAAEVQPDVLD